MVAVSTQHERAVVEQVPTQLLVGGEWREAGSGRRFPVEDPSTGEAVAEVADGGPDDALAALDAAAGAQEAWAAYPPRERGEILRRAFEELNRRADDLALLMTLEMGKPLRESRAEVVYAAEFFRWFSEEAVRVDGRYAASTDGKSRTIVLRQPVGPALLITPWNFPLAMGTRKIGPAIAAGCTMVIKPAQETPLSMLALAALLEEVGLPPGVVNVVPTTSAARTTGPLFDDLRLRKLSFTGSTEVGRVLMAQAAKNILRTSMELGGNAPFLVFEDADLDAAVEGAMIAKMRNLGESCVAANRFHVAEAVAADFASRLAERMGRLRVGRGTEEDTDVGPLVNAMQQGKVSELVEDAVERGAAYALEGGIVDGPGHFYRPAVLTEVPGDARLLREEIFGPVAPIATFTDEDEAVTAANDTEFGLVAYVYTRDITRALRVIEKLDTGMVGLNRGIVSNPAAPFGGVKQSGVGREGGREGIDEYLEVKHVAVGLGD
jgi:succinate-semialdehyde dehydrogenase/glutarate-semialdehyde dehydrogenase